MVTDLMQREADPHANLDALFAPTSIAVIGASTDETKIGGRPIRNLRLGGYPGQVFPINSRSKVVQGIQSFGSLREVARSIDLAIIALPALQVPDAVRDCAAAGVRAAIVFTAGFSEIGPVGAKAQAEIASIASRSQLRLLGPNCMGTINTRLGVLATFTSAIVDEAPEQGRIGLASQSGAFGSHCLSLMRERGLSFSLWATTGNQCDLEVADFLLHMAADQSTDIVIGSIEGIRDAGKLIRAFELAHQTRKPMIVMKVGRSAAGAEAVQSHTASLAGSDAIFESVCRQYGVHRAHTIDEIVDIAYAYSAKRLPASRRLGIVTVSGGVGVLMADAAEECGLDVPSLGESTQGRLKLLLPFAGTRNPVDVTAQILNDPELMEPMLSLLLEEGGCASVMVFLSHLGLNPRLMEKLMPGLRRIAEHYPDRYISLSLLAHPVVKKDLEEAGYTVFEDPTRAIRALAALTKISQGFANDIRAPAIAADVPKAATGRIYSEFEAKRFLRRAGLSVPKEALATSAEAAARAAADIGYPVVMKIASRDIAHKSDIGGVILDVKGEADVKSGYALLCGRVSAAAPEAHVDGVLVAPMLTGGVETVLGVFRDPVFGPVVMFGLGGIFVEILGDVVFRLAPFSVESAKVMIAQVRGRAILAGARGRPPPDLEALAQALARLSQIASANLDTILSIDINPFMVFAEGQGAAVADALIETAQEPESLKVVA